MIKPAFGVGGKNPEAMEEYFSSAPKEGVEDITRAQRSFLNGKPAALKLKPEDMKYLSPVLGLGYMQEDGLNVGGLAVLKEYGGKFEISYNGRKMAVEDREIAEWLFPDLYEGIGGGEAYTPDRDGKKKHRWLKPAAAILAASLALAGCYYIWGDDLKDIGSDISSGGSPSRPSHVCNIFDPSDVAEFVG
ncbi:MAG: hypothetical protein ACP5E4_02370, partial [Candidatus Aenigmatarchaeota archaeon]